MSDINIQPVQPEVEGELEHFQRRLTELGATDDEIMAIITDWYVDAPEWGDEDRRRTRHASDHVLVQMILQVRNGAAR